MAQKLGYFDDAGLDVSIETPADPSAPIKQVAAGRSDLAISYEPEVVLAHEKGLDVVAVGALVNRPLTSLIWLKKSKIKGVADLRGKTIATAGIPYQDAYLKTILARAGLSPSDVKTVNVGFGLLPAIVGGKRPGDARRLQQHRGRRPPDPRQGPGDHAGRQARRADLRRARPGRQRASGSKKTPKRSASSSPPSPAARRPP